ncbi:unnamed protein product [Angiostrongylus costaricensis]|uniref:ANK_REP_REGION domain-containing protein n=1 Tax=Angiostrongylus costaricensis TaxID=334426 RepID=A0A0R3PHN1_ANGCS|nr:unnamed protein product [Angiostrongylus costaricensis]
MVDEWIANGDVGKLEQLVLDGRGYLLKLATSKINAIHKAVEDGDVRRVKSLIDREQLALARDSYGR